MIPKENVSVLEFASCETTIIHCFAASNVLDVLRAPEGAIGFRVASEELICLSAHSAATSMFASLSAELESADAHALLLDRSDAWAVFTLSGPERASAFSRLCTTPLPLLPGFLQGAIGGVPAKAIILNDRIYLLVSSILGDYLRHRILEGCRDLAPCETPTAAFAVVEAPVNV